MITYTPGPWHTAKTGNHQGLIISESGANVAVSYDAKDAALIAAAPELLDALQTLLTETDQHARGNCPKLLDACRVAREMIDRVQS